VPAWPLQILPSDSEEAMWNDLWFKPQSIEWHRLGLFVQVAFYVQTFHLAIDPKATAAMKNAVLRMEGELGISTAGLASLKWRIVDTPGTSTQRPTPPNNGTPSGEQRTNAGARLTLVKKSA